MWRKCFFCFLVLSCNLFLFSEEPVYLKTIRINGVEKEVKTNFIGKMIYNQDGNTIYLEEKERPSFLVYYDKNGKMSKILKSKNKNVFYWYDYNDMTNDFELKTSDYEEAAFIYDENGNCIQEIDTGSQLNVNYEYDDNGNKTKKVVKNKNKNGIVEEINYEYDKNNNIIREYEIDSFEGISKYDEKNRIISYIRINNNKIAYILEYEYDDENNITFITSKELLYTCKIKKNSNDEITYAEEERIDPETNKKTFMQQEQYYDEKNNLLFSIMKIDDKIIPYYYENYYDNDKLIYSMKYLIIE